MVHFGYSYKQTGAKFAKAQAHDIDASFKDLGAVCDAIRHKNTDAAVELLEAVSEGDTPILYRKHNKRLGHRHELGGKKGRYPKKSAKLVLSVLRNAIANATFRGMGDELVVKHCCANKQRIFPRMAPRGTSRRANYETAIIEVVLEESPAGRKAYKMLKSRAAKALTSADKEKLVKEETVKLQNEITKLVKKKQQEKKDGNSEKKEEQHEHKEHNAHKK
jgi:large subunit ribosomal protein L22